MKGDWAGEWLARRRRVMMGRRVCLCETSMDGLGAVRFIRGAINDVFH